MAFNSRPIGPVRPILGNGGGRNGIIQGLMGGEGGGQMYPGGNPNGPPVYGAPILPPRQGGAGGMQPNSFPFHLFGRGENGHPFFNLQNWLASDAYAAQQHGGHGEGHPIMQPIGTGVNGAPGGPPLIPGGPPLNGGTQHPGPIVPNRQHPGVGQYNPGGARPTPRSFREALLQRALLGGQMGQM